MYWTALICMRIGDCMRQCVSELFKWHETCTEMETAKKNVGESVAPIHRNSLIYGMSMLEKLTTKQSRDEIAFGSIRPIL